MAREQDLALNPKPLDSKPQGDQSHEVRCWALREGFSLPTQLLSVSGFLECTFKSKSEPT